MKRGTMKTRDSGAFGLARRSATVVAMGATLCATAVGCGEGDGDPAVTTDEEALRCQSVPGGIAPGDCPWKTDVWSQLLPASGVDPVHTSSPALCSGSSGWVAISVDNTNHYRAYQFAANNQGQDWITYGTSRTFSSKPACAAREAYSDTRSGFLVAGRLSSNDANNKKIMVSPGIMGALGGPNVHVNPTFESGFVPVDNHTYSVGGLPAMGSYVADDGSGVVLLAFMDDDNVTPRAHVHKLKYTDPNNQWSARITGPALPTGWVAVGAPTIARLGFTFEIVVHARKGTTDALFKTFFYADGVNVNHFSNEIRLAHDIMDAAQERRDHQRRSLDHV